MGRPIANRSCFTDWTFLRVRFGLSAGTAVGLLIPVATGFVPGSALAQDDPEQPRLIYGIEYEGDTFDGPEQGSAILGVEHPFVLGDRTGLIGASISSVFDLDARRDAVDRARYAELNFELDLTQRLSLEFLGSGSRSDDDDDGEGPLYGAAIDVITALDVYSVKNTQVEAIFEYARSSEDYVRVEDLVDEVILDSPFPFPGTETFGLGTRIRSPGLEVIFELKREVGFAGPREDETRNGFEITASTYGGPDYDPGRYTYISMTFENVHLPDGSAPDRYYSVTLGTGRTLRGVYLTADAEWEYYQAVGGGSLASDYRLLEMDLAASYAADRWSTYWYTSLDRTVNFNPSSIENEIEAGISLNLGISPGIDLVLGGDYYLYEGDFDGGDFDLVERSLYGGFELTEDLLDLDGIDGRLRATFGKRWDRETSTFAGGGRTSDSGPYVGIEFVLQPKG
ncbi:hypothetical protein ACW9UR_20835 [Halovulum sp. GXIMD14794]